MDLPSTEAVKILSALAQSSRLDVFQLLMRVGEDGLQAGRIAEEIGARPNTLSTHLGILENAGVIQSRRDGRSIIYSADHGRIQSLIDFLINDCCDGQPDRCFPTRASCEPSASKASA